jgi:hypothetical protein
MVPIIFPETSVRNYRYTLRINPETSSSHLLRLNTRNWSLGQEETYCTSKLVINSQVHKPLIQLLSVTRSLRLIRTVSLR